VAVLLKIHTARLAQDIGLLGLDSGGAGAAACAELPEGAVPPDAGGGADGVLGALPPPMTESACWQGGETLAAFCWRQLNAAAPPVGTPEQCAWKSERQL